MREISSWFVFLEQSAFMAKVRRTMSNSDRPISFERIFRDMANETSVDGEALLGMMKDEDRSLPHWPHSMHPFTNYQHGSHRLRKG